MPRSLSRRWLIAALWITALALIAVQAYALRDLHAGQVVFGRGLSRSPPFVPAEWWRFAGSIVPLLMIGMALWVQGARRPGYVRLLINVALAALIPIGLLAAIMVIARGPSEIERVRSPSGGQFILAVEPIPTDTVYSLYQPRGPLGLWWQQVTDLDYSEDGRFTGSERLVLSNDAQWLLVARAGLWTDCFHLDGASLRACAVTVHPSWTNASYERDMAARSQEIQRLTGMVPPKAK